MAIQVAISQLHLYNQPCTHLHLIPMVKVKCRALYLGGGKSTSMETDDCYIPCTAMSLLRLNMCPFSFPLSFLGSHVAEISSAPYFFFCCVPVLDKQLWLKDLDALSVQANTWSLR